MTEPKSSRRRLGLEAIIVLLIVCPLTWAQDSDKLERLQEQNDKQQKQIEELQRQVRALTGGDDLIDEVADEVLQDVRDQILDLALGEVDITLIEAALDEGGMPAWLSGLTFFADLRLRYEGAWHEDSVTYPEDRNRGRYRLRFGFKKTWGSNDDWSAGMRFASGSEVPTSANQTFDDFFTKKPLRIDRAWLKVAPDQGVFKGLELIGGKMANPLLTTWTHWDTDVNPEGAFEKYTVDLFDGDLKIYANFAQFFVNEHSKRPDDMTLLVYGGGLDATLIKEGDFTAKGGFACNFYDYTHVRDNTPPFGNNPTTTVNGRTFVAAEDFDILDFVAYLEGKAWGVDYKLYGSVGVNTGVDENAPVNAGAEYDDNWNIGLKLGRGKKQGDITIEGSLFSVEANSVFAFAASDIGGADHQGGVIRAFYNPTDFAKFGGSVYFVDEISERDESIDHFDKLQIDLSIKF